MNLEDINNPVLSVNPQDEIFFLIVTLRFFHQSKKKTKTAAIKPCHVAPAIVSYGLVTLATRPECRRLPQVLRARLGSVSRRNRATWGKFFVCTRNRSP